MRPWPEREKSQWQKWKNWFLQVSSTRMKSTFREFLSSGFSRAKTMRKELSREPFGNGNLKMCRFENLKMRNDKDNLIVKMTFDLALEVIEFSEEIRNTNRFEMASQTFKCGTSIGANVMEAQN